jgi:hypothetical protein
MALSILVLAGLSLSQTNPLLGCQTDPVDSRCSNNGQCSSFGFCNCFDGFGGVNCEISNLKRLQHKNDIP